MQAVFVDATTGEASAHGDPRTRGGGAPSVRVPNLEPTRLAAQRSARVLRVQ
jgi:hypothetical protein